MNERKLRTSSAAIFLLAALIGVLVGLFFEPSTLKEELKKRLDSLQNLDWNEIEQKIRKG